MDSETINLKTKVGRRTISVGDILCRQNSPTELFEVEALYWHTGVLFSLKNPQLFKTVDVSRGGVCDWIITNYENEKDKWIMAKTEDIKNNMINEMDIENFKIFVEALEALPEEIKNNKVDMKSTFEPTCGSPGCFAGLISIVANDIPELKKIYDFDEYSYSAWSLALDAFLNCRFNVWAKRNRKAWGNVHGGRLYSDISAFGKESGDILTHNDIIVQLRKAFDKWALEVVKNGENYG